MFSSQSNCRSNYLFIGCGVRGPVICQVAAGRHRRNAAGPWSRRQGYGTEMPVGRWPRTAMRGVAARAHLTSLWGHYARATLPCRDRSWKRIGAAGPRGSGFWMDRLREGARTSWPAEPEARLTFPKRQSADFQHGAERRAGGGAESRQSSAVRAARAIGARLPTPEATAGQGGPGPCGLPPPHFRAGVSSAGP